MARWRLLAGRLAAEEAEGAGMGMTEAKCLEMGLGSFLKFSFGRGGGRARVARIRVDGFLDCDVRAAVGDQLATAAQVNNLPHIGRRHGVGYD